MERIPRRQIRALQSLLVLSNRAALYPRVGHAVGCLGASGERAVDIQAISDADLRALRPIAARRKRTSRMPPRSDAQRVLSALAARRGVDEFQKCNDDCEER